jgi:ATP-dependent helicase/nuclease subunit B
LRDAFSDALDRPALLPKIVALADVDEEFDPASGESDSLAAIPALRRRLLLATLVQHWGAARGSPTPLQQALNSAAELGRFLDESLTQGADLSRLAELAPGDFAAHWSDVISFLNIVAVQWPKLLEAEGTGEAAAIRDDRLRALAKRLAESPPDGPVIAAGSTGSIPATAALLTTIAGLPNGAVVLPGLDTHLDHAAWAAIEETHPQFGLKRLLEQMGAARDDVLRWPTLPDASPGLQSRVEFLSETLRPPPSTDAWRAFIATAGAEPAKALQNLQLIEAANPREEALAIACAMREALEAPGRTAALVTPDRVLARRVAAELSRWDIAIDDSAGVPLSGTMPGTFLSLLADAAAMQMAPVPLLALLKHPLASGGEDTARFRRAVRQLEIATLRGLRPEPGFAGIAQRLQTRDHHLQHWFGRLSRLLDEFAAATQNPEGDCGDIAKLHAAAAEALAATEGESGARRLWSGPAGEAAASLMRELMRDATGIALHPARQYADAFRSLADSVPVRSNYNLHPRLAILGPLEARLLDFDLVILGGLNEGKWPAQAATDPWLSRPMRQMLGLESPERRIGLSAHDFASLAAGRTVLLTRSVKENGSPTVASRWLLRLKQLAKGAGVQDALNARNDLIGWARQLDAGAPAKRMGRPAPTPPVDARPRSLSVTEIEKWIRDPYSIYAKHVLKLRPLDALDEEPGPAERGIAVHRALERFLPAFPDRLPMDAVQELLRIGREAFLEAGAGPAVLALWLPRFERVANWFVHYESERRKAGGRSHLEVKGQLRIPSAFGFDLRGRADRIDIFPGGEASILDYKTGRVPTDKQMERLLGPQLALEGAMLLRGAFPDIAARKLKEFVHVRLTGGDPPGEECVAKLDATELAMQAYDMLQKLVARYESESAAYRSWTIRERLTDKGDYDHLARVLEWWAGEEAEVEE